ncbi:MAG: MCP four helix bundle domain-containing protein [Deltaproteobacteria bacterium]|nr:MCP four helix bundle domain-containing protein [Deltaproteobacteria bacterium]
MKLTNKTVGARLGIGFGMVSLLLIAVGGIGYWSSDLISKTAIHEFKDMMATDAAISEHSARARANVLGLRRYEKDIYLNIGSKEKEEAYLNKWKEQQEHLQARIQDLGKAVTSRQDVDALNKMKSEMAAYVSGFNKVYSSIRTGNIKAPQEANSAINEYKEEIRSLEEAAQAFSSEGAKRMKEIENNIRTAVSQTKIFLIILSLISVVLGIGISILVARSITRPLSKVITGMTEGAEQVASASAQVSAASQSLAEDSSEQAAAIEETTSSLEEMSSMTKQNADNAHQSNALMNEAKQVVAKANESMAQLTRSMQEISKASEETSKIVKTIDEIAFQTNLLALNAAVEAARAGEAGAGFAVVADEVRNLAIRAADAAKNTAGLIEGTVKKVKDGSEMVSRTNEAFQQVADSSAKAADLVAEIAAASQEQAQGIAQINTTVTQMDKTTQQNAANAEETASASEEMNAQAEQMKILVNELMAMVKNTSGKGAGDGGRPAARASAVRKSVRGIPAPAVMRKTATQLSRRVKEIRPEEVIPMDDKDF